MSQKITLPKSTGEFEVVLEHDGRQVVYRPVPVVRSVRRRIRQAQWEFDQLAKRDEEDLAPDEREQLDAQALRTICDQINYVLVTEAEGAPPAGDMLYEGWEADALTEAQIYLFIAQLNKADRADPTPA
jgi:hypothetical protein